MAMALLLFVLLLLVRQALSIRDFHVEAGQDQQHSVTEISIAQSANFTEESIHYLTNAELETRLKDVSKRCSSISRLYSIGTTVRGTPLWVLEISDKPAQAEPEPAFKFVGNMHGDEPVGRELLVLLADWLCANYLKDPLATAIVEKVHLHLLPSLNPDGFANRTRGNANNVDLNRDFPDQFFTQNNDESERQPETLAIMNWIRKNNFVASASLHEGALVANYPWDGTSDTSTRYSRCSDDSTFRYLASIYSKFHKNMSRSNSFPGGITNGAAWYPLYGGMQDWNYIRGRCFELTLEISDTKWPPASQISEIWEDNRLSMLELVASTVKTGVHGRVQSSASGLPLAATISVQGYNQSITAGSYYGDYHRMLSPGKDYKVTASMPGYKNRTTTILLFKDEQVTLDFILDPLDSNVEHTYAQDKLIQMMTASKLSSINLPSSREMMPLVEYHFKLTSLCFVILVGLALTYIGFRRRGFKLSVLRPGATTKFLSKV